MEEHKPVKGKEERGRIDGQLYLTTPVKVGAPESGRFTASGSGSTTLAPIDGDGNPVADKRWRDPGFVEARISFLREDFECARLLEDLPAPNERAAGTPASARG